MVLPLKTNINKMFVSQQELWSCKFVQDVFR